MEGQLAEKRSENATIHEYEIQINELNHLAVSRAGQIELFKQSESDLRTALRQVRDVITYPASVVRDVNNTPSAVQLIDSVLNATYKNSNCISSLSNSHSQPNSQNHLFLSPRFKKHIELMHSSDSEYSDDDRDDISVQMAASTSLMADLALIAKGKVPPSLRSSNLLEMATTLSTDYTILQAGSIMKSTESSTTYPVCAPVDPHFEKNDKYSSSKQMYQSVFDRLGSPSQFTGTQKDKFHDSKARRDRSTEDAVISEKDPRSNLFSDSIPLHDSRASGAIDRAGYTKQNVFDRLQKTNTHAAAIRQSETLHVDSRPIYDGKSGEGLILGQDGSAKRNNQDENKRNPNEDDHFVELKYSGESRSAVDRAAYSKQNVFDRLQKTTTLASAVRQSETLQLESRVITDHKHLISPVAVENETLPVKKSEAKKSSTMNKQAASNDTTLNVF